MDVSNKKILITHSSRFMGPALVEALSQAGAHVVPCDEEVNSPDSLARMYDAVGDVDVVVANLAHPRPDIASHELQESDVRPLFEALVYPLMTIGRQYLPGMYGRRSGKIVVVGSAAPLRAFPKSAAYAAARAAQHAWVRATAVEAAPMGVQVNATAQIFVENPEYFPAAYQETAEFRQRITEVPAGRLGSGEEGANLVRYLASDACNFLSGAIIPLTGAWAS